MPAKKPVKTTDKRRGKAPPAIKQPKARSSLAAADAVYQEAANKPFTPLFRDRRNP